MVWGDQMDIKQRGMSASLPMKRIPLTYTYNTRDLGGLATGDGRVTSFGRLLRSDLPARLDCADVSLLKRLGIARVIDLRTKEEALSRPSAFESCPDFEFFHCPFSVGNGIPSSVEEFPVLYGAILSDYPAIRRIMEIIAAPGGVLYHCAAGKDRTGIVSMLMLLAAGVTVSDILADYQVSYTYLRVFVRGLLERRPDWSPFVGRSDMEFMEATLDNFFARYGSVRDYLHEAGLTPAQTTSLEQKLF